MGYVIELPLSRRSWMRDRVEGSGDEEENTNGIYPSAAGC